MPPHSYYPTPSTEGRLPTSPLRGKLADYLEGDDRYDKHDSDVPGRFSLRKTTKAAILYSRRILQMKNHEGRKEYVVSL